MGVSRLHRLCGQEGRRPTTNYPDLMSATHSLTIAAVLALGLGPACGQSGAPKPGVSADGTRLVGPDGKLDVDYDIWSDNETIPTYFLTIHTTDVQHYCQGPACSFDCAGITLSGDTCTLP